MKPFSLLILILLVLPFTTCLAQSQTDTIRIEKGISPQFVLNGKSLTPKQLMAATKSNTASLEEMKIARRNHAIASVFGIAGGAFVGYQIGTAVGGGRPNWALAGVGAGLIGVSVPFGIAYTRHARKAVLLYNAGLQAAGQGRVDVKVGVAFNKIGIRFTF